MSSIFFASAISEIQQSDVFMTVKARICEAPAANLNGARVTEAFINEIVDNEESYVGLPLYADIKALTSGRYRRLGHLYDSRTGEFHSTQIGSFYHFEKEEFEGGCYLVGYARIPKRNKKLSKAITDLWTDNALKFSFEVAVGEYEALEDGTVLIDQSENNYLEGTAIVSFPACEEAVALELVAQQEADDTEGGDEEMADEKMVAEVEETVTETAEETKEPEQVEEVEEAEKKKEECSETETAQVFIREEHKESNETFAVDTETGVEVRQKVEVETEVCHTEDGEIVNVNDEMVAEETQEVEETPTETIGEDTDTPTEATGEDTDTPSEADATDDEPAEDISIPADPEKKTAEQQIAELTAAIESLKQEISELKTHKETAEVIAAEINPFVDPIQMKSKYSLLEKDTPDNAYSLLSK